MPGSLIYTGEQHLDEMRLEMIRFNPNEFEERLISFDELSTSRENGKITWLNVVGLHETDKIRLIGDAFQIHNLALEDILNMGQRPTFDEYDEQYFIVTKMIRVISNSIISEQFSMIIGENFLITFQEKEGDIFEGVRNRLRTVKGKIRSRGSDYLSFALLDVVVDYYMAIIDDYGAEINDQEVKLMDEFDREMINDINMSKKEVNYLRKYARPLRDTILNFNKSDHHLIEDGTRPFLNDLLDHISHVTDTIEVYRESINDNFNTYNTFMNNKLNDVLKILTIFSVIFIPLTFLAGIYGMNFENMPELQKPYAYPTLLIVMVILAMIMIIYFKRKKWL
jgi:magnesium transporter